ncbi:hypothetical protein [Macrococcoides bohemicum]|uniref:hypothetical protein n=1 Tax=Macrococcoides bohemicum TaxID=1903056 RepID=UPI0028A1A390|nr:hypothetical protein [Macrococcus bohemicus]
MDNNINKIYVDLANKFTEKFGTPTCNICNSKKYFDPSFYKMNFDDNFEPIQPDSYLQRSMITFVCPNCGHTDWFNTNIIDKL